jgi:hypothetical protein
LEDFSMNRVPRYVLCATILCSGFATPSHAQTEDNLVFIHHSCGGIWLYDGGLRDALLDKAYIDEQISIEYGSQLEPDPGRPASLAPTPGDNTDMIHWIYWFNDYLQGIRTHGAQDGVNRIVMFKSCYPNTYIPFDDIPPGDPFWTYSPAHYRAVYRHPDGPTETYIHPETGYEYLPLEQIFAAHPDILFIPVTFPPMDWADIYWQPPEPESIARYRGFQMWLRDEWWPSYQERYPNHNNVFVLDWYDFLANPADAVEWPNFLRPEYGGGGGDSHPNEFAVTRSTEVFATSPGNFFDSAWGVFSRGDATGDGSVDLADYAVLPDCLTGPGAGPPPANCTFDLEPDGDVDLADVARLSNAFHSAP